MFITSEHQPLGFGGAHGLTAETVVVALEGTKTIKHSKRLSSRITSLEVPWNCVAASSVAPVSAGIFLALARHSALQGQL
jgi:hypothetical protein